MYITTTQEYAYRGRERGIVGSPVIDEKIRHAICTNKLNPEILGRRKWYQYIIEVEELIWARNFWDGYQIHVYSRRSEEIGEHLGTVWI